MRYAVRISAAMGILLFSFLAATSSAEELRRVQAWPSPAGIPLLSSASGIADTTLPAPTLKEEPPYTWGYENTIHWDRQHIADILAPLGYTLFLFECVAGFRQTELWGFVGAQSDSATFGQLPTGVTISYRIRYYARDAQGGYARSLWSNSVYSIQDSSPPVIETFEVVDLKESGLKKWVDQRTIQIRLIASDPDSGKIMQIAYRERNAVEDRTFKYDVDPPTAVIDRIIPYTMYASEHESVTLSVWVVDVAGQVSDVLTESLFWWEYEEMVCFPNPFHPERDEMSTITLNTPGITRVNIYDVFGNLVRVLDRNPSGDFFEWDGRNGLGDPVAKGGYLCVADGHEKMYCKIAVWK